MTERPVLITDIDNTLFNWVDYFAPAFRAMVHVLHDATGITEEQLTHELRITYERCGTLEYSFVLQRLPSLAHLAPDALDALIARVSVAFGRSRRKRMHPYPGVAETLQWMLAQGICVVAVSNAPLYFAVAKLKRLGLIRYVQAVAAWEGPAADHHSGRYSEVPRVRRGVALLPVPAEQRKPSPAMYELVLRHVGASPSATWCVGDSFSGDIVPSLDLGLNPLWATYGLTFEDKNLATVRQLTPGGPTVTDSAYSKHPVRLGVPTLGAFCDIRLHVPTVQAALF